MSIRVSNAFVAKFYQEWKATGDAMLQQSFGDVTVGERHHRVEDFLDRLLDAGLVDELLRNVRQRHRLRNPQLFLADSHILLDNKSAST